ncbi:hypothetical protein [Pseudomonas amygdali]|uniref:hypothetical protein n=1 Tax=Pseudomonas amygdali TaxID=47877 RepID=UPI00070C110E|nr:hypothetical protein [Pseudomonas amygdali]KWS79710.1 hypothetical protein AL052_25355 [Pseudomonas amygdali pv. eriobotryae]
MTTTQRIRTRKENLAIRKHLESKRLKPKGHDEKNDNGQIGTPIWKINLGLVLLALFNLSLEKIYNSIELYLFNNFATSIFPPIIFIIIVLWFYVITPALLMKILILYGKASRAEPYK